MGLIKDVTDDMNKKIQLIIKQGILDKLSNQEIADNLDSALKGSNPTKFNYKDRLKMIARTERHRALGVGAHNTATKLGAKYKYIEIVDDDVLELQLGKDFTCRGFTGSGNFTAQVVFCGYGLSEPELGYDDYKNVDVKNKIVMVFKYNPHWKIDNKDWGSNYPREKSNIAARKGAKGIIFLSLPNDKNPQKPIGSVLHGEGKQLENFPQIHIDIPIAVEWEDKSINILSSF
jgi:hypothetical protein